MGDTIECGYHGFTYEQKGRCVLMPTQPQIPAGMKLHRYPVAEHLGWVWVWTGDPERADPALLPRPPYTHGPGWELWHGHDHLLQACYTLLLDNLFDLSHVGWIHASYFRGPNGELPAGMDAPMEMRTVGDELYAVRRHKDTPYDAVMTLQYGPGRGLVELEGPSDYHGPALTVTGMINYFERDGAGPHAIPMGDRMGGALRVLHGITPETRYTTHYFAAFARNFRLGDEGFSKAFAEMDIGVRLQDCEALAAIEPEAKRVKPGFEQSALQDAAGIRVRRLLAQQIRREHDTASSGAPVAGRVVA